MLTFILAISLAMFISFLCSILESTLLSLSTTDIAKISEKNPMLAKIWRDFKQTIQKPIAVILIVNTLSHTIGATVSGAQFNTLFGTEWLWLFSLIFSLMMIQWTEILPKTIGVKYNKRIALITGLPLSFLVKLFKPIVFLTHLLNRPFEGKKTIRSELDALDEIRVLAHFSSSNKLINQDQENIISKSTNLSNTKVSQIMIKKSEIKTLSSQMNLMQALVEAHIHHHTRYPLAISGNVDEIMGYVNFKDIVTALRINPKNPTLLGILRPVIVVNPNDSLNHILTRLTKGHNHMAIVKDHKGETLGLVTMEDLFEFMLGDIEDEYDILPDYFYQIYDNRYIAGGGSKLSAIHKTLGDEVENKDISLSEWLITQFKKIPAVEETYKSGKLNFIVRKIRRSKIFEVIIEIK